MSKLVVESNWLLDSFGTPKELREQALVDLAMEGIQFLTPLQEQAMNNPAAQFAGRMESVLSRIISEHPRVSLFSFDAPTHCHNEHAIWDESGLPCEWCKLWDEASGLLADIQKAKGE